MPPSMPQKQCETAHEYAMQDMTEKSLQDMAEAAGLGLAFQLFPEDIRAAVKQVANQRAALRDDISAAEEPWPPMTIPGK